MTYKNQPNIGEFVTASGEKLSLDQSTIDHVLLVGDTGSDKPETLLSKLDAAELSALEKWAASQSGTPVDLMRWPGWAEALRRNVIKHPAAGDSICSAALLRDVRSAVDTLESCKAGYAHILQKHFDDESTRQEQVHNRSKMVGRAYRRLAEAASELAKWAETMAEAGEQPNSSTDTTGGNNA